MPRGSASGGLPRPSHRDQQLIAGLHAGRRDAALVPLLASAPDQGSTTGTTPREALVGRVSGQDLGYAGETGAERRAKWEAEQEQEQD